MFVNKQQARSVLMAMVALLLACTLTITAFAATDLSTNVGVTDLTVSSTGTTAFTSPAAGQLKWTATTDTTTEGCDTTTNVYTGGLTMTNNSSETKMLTFDYTVSLSGGSVTIDGSTITANSSFSKILTAGAGISISTSSGSSEGNSATLTITNINLEVVPEVTLTFAVPTNGSYTVNGTAVTEKKVVTDLSSATYNLVATPATNYTFAGWYVDDVLYSTEASLSGEQFLKNATIIARFALSGDDPLYIQAKVPQGTYTKDQLVSINSYYFHDTTNKVVADGGFPGNNTAYSKTAASQIKDKIDVQYLPSLVWDNNMAISFSGTAYGDYVDGGMQESYCYARALSDVIRIYAKENCYISFDYTNSMTGGNSETSNGVYYYITTASNATVANVKSGTKLTEKSGSSGTIAVSKGNYLYILLEGYTKDRQFNVAGSSQKSMKFSYSASISNFTVEYNQKKDILTAGFRDNTGKVLGSGTLSVNSVNQTIGTNGNMADMTFADQAAVTLAVSAAPANYVHIGWEVTPAGGSTTRVYTPTYSRTLTENVIVNALFVPKTIITMGANGYTDAIYTDVNGTALSGQYVARNANCTAYYTSLADAFSKTDVVVLLADTTINGDWTIPAGKTFVIPCGMNDAGSTTPVTTTAGMSNSDYCKVNMNGNLTVNGALMVSSQQNEYSGTPGGLLAHLSVASGKRITVNGTLYAHGPITGAGSIVTSNSAKVYEYVQIPDNSPVMYVYNTYNERGKKEVFLFNGFFPNTIEVPVTYPAGATLTGRAAVRYDTVSTADIPLIGSSGAMINCTSGSITKYYDHSTGQFVFRINPDAVAFSGPFSLTLTVTVAGRTMDITVNTAEYFQPMASPYRFEIAGNLTMNGDYKFLPGATIDVLDTGTCTISSGSRVVLYRRNDYDYRGRHSNSTEQWGYSATYYPMNPARFPGVNYPVSFNESNMGSAKLNVDGTLIVEGGLYVTDELQTEGNGITLRDNGYNYLTGSGTIDMTNANVGLTSINEVMTATGTNDLKWDTVEVVPLKGLKADATANEAGQYESLNGKTVTGSTNVNGLNVWSEDPCAAGHALEATAAVDSNCYKQGNSAYWTCGTCGKYFSDADGKTEIEEDGWILELADHTYDEGVVTAEPNCTEKGVKTYTCSVCPEDTEGHTKTEEIAALNHDSEGDDDHICNREGCGAAISTCKDNATPTSAVVPTCVSGGNSAYWTCGVCGKFYSDADCTAEIAKDSWVLQIDGSAHDWDTVTYSFADDGKACTATHVCKLNGEHKETAEATITPTVSTQATCVAKGKTTYIATFTADWATQQTKIVEDIPATGDHTEATPVVENDVKATCTADGSYDEVVYCTVCKAEVSRETKTTGATGHTEGAAVSEKVVDPTCLAGGSYDSVVYCTVCEAELSREPKTTEATGHEAGEAVTENKVDATCTAVGSYDSVTYCTVCKAEISRKSIEIPMAAHTPGDAVTENKVDATCTVDGSYDTVTYCTVCKKELTRSTTPVTALGHTNGDAVIENKVDATCTEKGSYDSVIYCTVCGAEVSRTPVEVDATDHTSGEAVIENKVDATCTAKGSYDSVVYCTECGVEISRNTITVDEIAHTKGTVQTENVTDPTCTAEGSHDEVIYCTVCGKELSRNTVKDAALGHKGGEPVSENEKAPTCNKKGSYESVIYCSVCSVEVSRTTVEVPATGEHTESAHVVENEVAATCTTDGSYDEVVYCSVCNTELSRSTETVAALGHKNDTPVIENEVAATCTAKGSYDTVVYCTVCNAEQSRVTTTVDALNHKYNAVVTNPTCTVDGYTTYTCDNCGDTYVDDKVAAVGHTKAAPVVENSVDATCDNAGGYDTVVYCTVCGAEVSRVPTTVDALGHKYVGETTAPTCTAAGYTTYTCSVCKHTYTADEVPALGHKYDDGVVTTEPNCTDKGVKTFTCACGDNYTEEVAALGHKYDAVVTAPTCTAAGYTTYTCSVCKHTYTADEVPALGHKYDDGVVTTDPTCTKEGVKTFTCGTCGHSYTEKVEAAGHKYNAVVTAPNCSSDGFTTYTCSTCGDSKTGDNVSKLGHTDVIDEPVAPSCTETGLTEGSHCSVCGKITKAQEVISATGHTSGEVKKENEVPATCTKPGSYNEVTYCSVCEKESSRTTVTVPALKHKDDNKDHICDNGCGEPQGEHAAANGSHNCGYCGEKVSDCADNDGDHNCDVCDKKLSSCTDKTGDEDHKCDICDEDGITAHDWTPATYDAPKTCTECGTTMGDPLVRPVEIVKPEDVTADPSGGISKEEVEEAMSSVIDSIVEAAQKTEQPETGINAEKNKTAVENAKTEIKDKDQNVVTDANYETSLVITLNAVVLDKDEEKVITKKITFDVSPILYALDANGAKIGQTKITSFAEPITFRLPVAENAKAQFARVLHEGVDDLGLYKILTDAAGNRFVEVKAKNFSQFSLILEEECTDHNFVDGKCTICGAEEPVTLVDFAGTTMTLGNSLAMNFVIDTALLNGTDHYAVITKTYADKSPISKTIQQADWNVYDGTLYYFAFDDIAAKEMGDELTVIVYRNDGTQVSVVRKDSVYDYAMRMLVKEESKASPNPEKLTLYVDMLNYGAAAQTEFEYSLNTLVNRDLTEAQQAYATNYMDISDSRIKGNGYAGSTLTLKSNIILNFVFNKTVVSKDMYAIATYKNHYGYDKNVRIEGDKFVEYDDARWYIPVSGMVVADCSSLVTITIYNADGTIVTSAADSVESYVARMSSAKPLYLAIIKFGLAAYASFH